LLDWTRNSNKSFGNTLSAQRGKMGLGYLDS
jgi:hypothetical protein